MTPFRGSTPGRPFLVGVFAFVVASLCGRDAATCATCPQLPTVERVIELDRLAQALPACEEERELRTFTLLSYRNIADELISGLGPYSEALIAQLQPGCVTDASIQVWLRSLLLRSNSAVEFARRVALAGHEVHKQTNSPSGRKT